MDRWSYVQLKAYMPVCMSCVACTIRAECADFSYNVPLSGYLHKVKCLAQLSAKCRSSVFIETAPYNPLTQLAGTRC